MNKISLNTISLGGNSKSGGVVPTTGLAKTDLSNITEKGKVVIKQISDTDLSDELPTFDFSILENWDNNVDCVLNIEGVAPRQAVPEESLAMLSVFVKSDDEYIMESASNAFTAYMHIPKIPLVADEGWVRFQFGAYFKHLILTPGEDILNGDAIRLKRVDTTLMDYCTIVGGLDDPNFEIDLDEDAKGIIKYVLYLLGWKGSTDGDLVKFALNEGLIYSAEDTTHKLSANSMLSVYGCSDILQHSKPTPDLNLKMYQQPISGGKDRYGKPLQIYASQMYKSGIYPYVYVNDLRDESNLSDIIKGWGGRVDIQTISSETDNNGWMAVHQTISDREGHSATRQFYVNPYNNDPNPPHYDTPASTSGSLVWTKIPNHELQTFQKPNDFVRDGMKLHIKKMFKRGLYPYIYKNNINDAERNEIISAMKTCVGDVEIGNDWDLIVESSDRDSAHWFIVHQTIKDRLSGAYALRTFYVQGYPAFPDYLDPILTVSGDMQWRFGNPSGSTTDTYSKEELDQVFTDIEDGFNELYNTINSKKNHKFYTILEHTVQNGATTIDDRIVSNLGFGVAFSLNHFEKVTYEGNECYVIGEIELNNVGNGNMALLIRTDDITHNMSDTHMFYYFEDLHLYETQDSVAGTCYNLVLNIKSPFSIKSISLY